MIAMHVDTIIGLSVLIPVFILGSIFFYFNHKYN